MNAIKDIKDIWIARTPAYLHPNTKENLIWQLKLTGVIIVGMVAYDVWEEHQMRKKFKTIDTITKNI